VGLYYIYTLYSFLCIPSPSSLLLKYIKSFALMEFSLRYLYQLFLFWLFRLFIFLLYCYSFLINMLDLLIPFFKYLILFARRKFPISYQWEIVVSTSIARGGNVLVLFFYYYFFSEVYSLVLGFVCGFMIFILNGFFLCISEFPQRIFKKLFIKVG
jgi:hypothetical protein